MYSNRAQKSIIGVAFAGLFRYIFTFYHSDSFSCKEVVHRMPIMTRMRDSMPVILFGLLIAFLITIVFEWGMDYLGLGGRSRADIIGNVNGKKISYKEFSDILRNYVESRKAQGQKVSDDEEESKQDRDQVWQSMVTQTLIDQEIQRLGLKVTDQEIQDLVQGENPPEDLRRYFVDSTGQFRRDVYDEFLRNPDQFIRDPQGANPNYGTGWLVSYETNLRQRLLQEKLQSVVLASVRVTDGEIRERYAEQAQKLDALYALFDPNVLVRDSAVQLTDADLKSYYEENIDQYKYEASRKLQYVLFQEKASAGDSAARLTEMDEVVEKAKGGADFIDLVYTNSDKPDSGAFFSHGELSPAIENAVFAAKVGSVVGPLQDAAGLHLFKVLDERKSSKEFIHASHILFSLEGQPDSNAVKATAAKVLKLARAGKDFAELAKEYSKDPGSAVHGGDLGWFTKGRMVPAFEAAAFRAKPGEIVGPVRTQFGLHIIKVLARDARDIKLADVLIRIAPSSQTKNDIADRAKEFAYNTKGSEFSNAAQSYGLQVLETQIQGKTGVIPGIGINEHVTKWAFDSKVGSTSEPISVSGGTAVFNITEAKDAGVRPFDEVKESLRPMVLRKKKLEAAAAIAASVREKLGPADSLTKVSQLEPGIAVQRTGPFALAGSVPGVGRDQSFIGAASGLQVGQISPAIQGVRGAYLIQLVSKTAIDSATFAAQKESLRTRMLQERRSRFLSDWLTQLKDKAEIDDHRDSFYR